MNRLGKMIDLIGQIPTILRTARHLRGAQARAQVRHVLFGLPANHLADGPPPALAIEQPKTPFLGPPAHIRRHRDGRFEMLATPFDIQGGIDWEAKGQGPLFAYHLHQHEFLRIAECSQVERSRVLGGWLENGQASVGWDPHPISLRLLCWGKLLMTPGALNLDDELRVEMLRSMASQAEALSCGLEVRLQANHLLSNLISVVFAGVLLDGPQSDSWLDRTEALVAELDLQIRPDGGHEERSPMYHSLLLENLLDLLNLCQSVPDRAPEGLVQVLEETASRMLGALDLLTHRDGQIALFADAAFDIASEPEALIDYASQHGISRASNPATGLLPQSGYLRLSAGAFDLIASVGGPSPAHQPGHAHCDALAFELSIGGDRLVTDTGLFEYEAGIARDIARSTASHATIQFDGEEQAEIWAAHRIGGRPRVELVAWDAEGFAEATCRGWSRQAPLHRRFFSVNQDCVAIEDRIVGRYRELRFCLPIDPAWHIELTDRGACASRKFEPNQDRRVEIELPRGLSWALERSPYFPSFGKEVERFVLVGRGDCGDVLRTQFRRIA